MVKPEYEALNQAFEGLSNYEALDRCDFESVDNEDWRKWIQDLSLSFSVTHFIYAYCNYLGYIHIVWKMHGKIEEITLTEDARLANISRANIITFATRKMREDFIEKCSESCKTLF